jgi:hypothetical protein
MHVGYMIKQFSEHRKRSFVVNSIKTMVIVLVCTVCLFHSDFSNATCLCGEFSQNSSAECGVLEVDRAGKVVVKRLTQNFRCLLICFLFCHNMFSVNFVPILLEIWNQ